MLKMWRQYFVTVLWQFDARIIEYFKEQYIENHIITNCGIVIIRILGTFCKFEYLYLYNDYIYSTLILYLYNNYTTFTPVLSFKTSFI